MKNKLNTQGLIDFFATKSNINQSEAKVFIKEFFTLIQDGLLADKLVKIKGLGTFKLIDVENRESIDVNTGERIEIKKHTKVSFIPDKGLKETINKPFALFETVTIEDDNPITMPATAAASNSESLTNTNNRSDSPNPDVSTTQESNTQPQTDSKPQEKEKQQQFAGNPKNGSNSSQQQSNPKTKGNSSLKYIVGSVLLIVLLLVIILLFHTFSQKSLLNKSESEPTESVDNNLYPSTTDTISSYVENRPNTSLPKADDKNEPSDRKTADFSTLLNELEDQYSIAGEDTTYIIQEGETLVKVSRRFFGTKDMWPLLAKFNQDVITNPHHVWEGLVIRIPKLKKKE